MTQLIRPAPIRASSMFFQYAESSSHSNNNNNNNNTKQSKNDNTEQLLIEQFYEETYAAGISTEDIHDAVRVSQQWNSRWSDSGYIGVVHTTSDAFASSTVLVASRSCNPAPHDLRYDSSLDTKGDEYDDEEYEAPVCLNKRQHDILRQFGGLVEDDDDDDDSTLSTSSSTTASSSTSAAIPKKTRRLENIMARPKALSPITSASIHTQIPHVIMEEEESESDVSDCCDDVQEVTGTGIIERPLVSAFTEARDGLLKALVIAKGETSSKDFQACLKVLTQQYRATTTNQAYCKSSSFAQEGTWLNLCKPTFVGCLGETAGGDPLYTLGRMSFDMYSPENLVCSIQGTFNHIETVTDRASILKHHAVPSSLRDDVENPNSHIRTYNIMVAFTIEPESESIDCPNKGVQKPIKAIMTTTGYTVTDPFKENRQSVWLTGGKMEPNNTAHDQRAWKDLFHSSNGGIACSPSSSKSLAKQLASKFFLGAKIDPVNHTYTLTRPTGGHGLAYVDTIYMDETLRIVRGHRGTLFVFTRVQK